jgi:hypothetical protein
VCAFKRILAGTSGQDSSYPARLFRHLDRSETSQGKLVPAWYDMGGVDAVSTGRGLTNAPSGRCEERKKGRNRRNSGPMLTGADHRRGDRLYSCDLSSLYNRT